MADQQFRQRGGGRSDVCLERAHTRGSVESSEVWLVHRGCEVRRESERAKEREEISHYKNAPLALTELAQTLVVVP